jgi:hypothetical protein
MLPVQQPAASLSPPFSHQPSSTLAGIESELSACKRCAEDPASKQQWYHALAWWCEGGQERGTAVEVLYAAYCTLVGQRSALEYPQVRLVWQACGLFVFLVCGSCVHVRVCGALAGAWHGDAWRSEGWARGAGCCCC